MIEAWNTDLACTRVSAELREARGQGRRLELRKLISVDPLSSRCLILKISAAMDAHSSSVFLRYTGSITGC